MFVCDAWRSIDHQYRQTLRQIPRVTLAIHSLSRSRCRTAVRTPGDTPHRYRDRSTVRLPMRRRSAIVPRSVDQVISQLSPSDSGWTSIRSAFRAASLRTDVREHRIGHRPHQENHEAIDSSFRKDNRPGGIRSAAEPLADSANSWGHCSHRDNRLPFRGHDELAFGKRQSQITHKTETAF